MTDKSYKFYSIDDRLLLRWRGPGTLYEHYTENGWEMFMNPERFDTEAEEITEEQARALLKERKAELQELKATA